ncbi:MAG: type IV pilus twitching motility protein PilT [Bdellovibrionota bacterium]
MSSALKAVKQNTSVDESLQVSESSATQAPTQSMRESRPNNTNKPSMKYLLHALVKHGASDLHLKSNRPPLYRINGKLVAAKMPELSGETIKEVLYSVLTDKLIRDFERNLQVDCSFQFEGLGRFRANIYLQRGTVAGVIRMIPLNIPGLESLGLPSVLKEIALKKRGLVLITGSTGCGKSTTMAAMLNYINEHRHSHIITIEDPIEFVFRDIKSSVCQREVGADAGSMHDALVGALHQDPDVITIGEMRQYETIEAALTAAETGHLVLSTLHTNDAKSSIDRIVDVFPPNAKNQVRIQLSACLLAVVSQKLVPRADGEGRVAVCEVLIKSPTIENLILNNELDKIEEAMATSTTYYKMQTFNQALERLVMKGVITNEDAIFASNSPEELKMRLSGFKKEEGF